MHHPWRAFRSLVDWTLRWSHDLPEDRMGEVDYRTRTVTLAHGLTQAERRCVIAHEAEHIKAGPVAEHLWPREEKRIDRLVARRLIPFDALVEALAWTQHPDELAEELWVDRDTVVTRLNNLTEAEGRELQYRLDEIERTMPRFD